jgi:hypothetical protein
MTEQRGILTMRRIATLSFSLCVIISENGCQTKIEGGGVVSGSLYGSDPIDPETKAALQEETRELKAARAESLGQKVSR